MPGCAGDRFLKRPQLWKGVQYVVLRSDVHILWIDCLGLESDRSGHSGDSEFLDPVWERDRIAVDPHGGGTYRQNLLKDQMRHGDSQARGIS